MQLRANPRLIMNAISPSFALERYLNQDIKLFRIRVQTCAGEANDLIYQ